jgi:hypothetical protein
MTDDVLDDACLELRRISPGPIVDPFVRIGIEPGSLDVPMPRDALRDDASREAWPSTGMVGYLFTPDAAHAERYEIADSLDRWLANLDRFGISRAQVPLSLDTSTATFDKLADLGGRILVSVRVDPHEGMRAIRRLRSLATDYPNIRSVSLTPHTIYPFIAPNSKEYYPVYAACVELDLTAFINVGFPGPRVPAAIQDPIHLDEVCWFFPDLRVVMRHGGEPWVDTCIKMLLRWPNLYYATTAFAPRYYPEAMVSFLNSRGHDKVMFAGYWPTLPYERVLRELAALPLKPDVWPAFLRDNAVAAFGIDRGADDAL